MNRAELLRRRLLNQRLAGTPFERPDDVVRHLGAVQAQDYAGAKWAVAQRTVNITDASLERDLTEGRILRTHVLRPTWHFVVPDDIGWLLALTAPRVHARNARWYRDLEHGGLDLARTDFTLAGALAGGRERTRAELARDLREAGIEVEDGLPLTIVMMHAELNALICSGAPRGKQQTYALLAERAPESAPLAREEAVVRLATRYFTSHGPATLKDFVWWSGLTLTEAKIGVELAGPRLERATVDGESYWLEPSVLPEQDTEPNVRLLPNYDEYSVAYADRGAIFSPSLAEKLDSRRNPIFQHTVLVDGRVAGTWQRTLRRESVLLQATLFRRLSQPEADELGRAAARYGDFLARPLTVASGLG